MTVSEYERRFRELLDLCPNLVADEVSKTRRFLDGLSEPIALSLSGSDHPTYQLMRDAALEVERQTLIRQTKRRSYDGLSSGSPSQGSSKRGSFSSGSSGSRGSSGDRRSASGSRFQRGGHTHGPGLRSVSSGSSHFQRSAGRDGFRSTCGVCGKIHDGPCQWDNVCFQCGQTGHFRRDCPIEDPTRLESQDQVLSSNRLVGMEDWIHRQGIPRVVPLARDSSLHLRLEAGDREDDHLLEAEFML